MAKTVKFDLKRGEKSYVKNIAYKNGQIIIGTIDDKMMALYHDTYNKQGEPIRVELDITDYIKQLERLEKIVEELEDSVIIVNRLVPNPDNLDVIAIQTNDKLNILTNNSDRIIYIDSVKDNTETGDAGDINTGNTENTDNNVTNNIVDDINDTE